VWVWVRHCRIKLGYQGDAFGGPAHSVFSFTMGGACDTSLTSVCQAPIAGGIQAETGFVVPLSSLCSAEVGLYKAMSVVIRLIPAYIYICVSVTS
jgi:hypothetical protein